MVATITVAAVTTTSVLAASAVASATQVRLITVRGAGASEVTLHAGAWTSSRSPWPIRIRRGPARPKCD